MVHRSHGFIFYLRADPLVLFLIIDEPLLEPQPCII